MPWAVRNVEAVYLGFYTPQEWAERWGHHALELNYVRYLRRHHAHVRAARAELQPLVVAAIEVNKVRAWFRQRGLPEASPGDWERSARECPGLDWLSPGRVLLRPLRLRWEPGHPGSTVVWHGLPDEPGVAFSLIRRNSEGWPQEALTGWYPNPWPEGNEGPRPALHRADRSDLLEGEVRVLTAAASVRIDPATGDLWLPPEA